MVGLICLAGCHSSGGAVIAPTTTAPLVSVAPATTSTAPPTTTFQPSAVQPSPDRAGGHLVSAWKAGDRAAALSDATPAAVDALFSQPFPAGGVQDRQCSSAVAGPSTCVYRILATGGLLSLSAVSVSGGWAISAARFQS